MTPSYSAVTGMAPEPSVVWVPLYDQFVLSSLDGSIVWERPPSDALAFQRKFIDGDLRADHAKLVLTRVRGDSMEPVLSSGDVVLVDRAASAVERDGMYCLRLQRAVVVKWLQLLPSGAVRVSSENAARFPAVEMDLTPEGRADVEVIGLVRWWGHTAG